MTTEAAIIEHLDKAEQKAWEALAGYKFQMFGYWSAIWIHLNRISGLRRPNPWKELVLAARKQPGVIEKRSAKTA